MQIDILLICKSECRMQLLTTQNNVSRVRIFGILKDAFSENENVQDSLKCNVILLITNQFQMNYWKHIK